MNSDDTLILMQNGHSMCVNSSRALFLDTQLTWPQWHYMHAMALPEVLVGGDKVWFQLTC